MESITVVMAVYNKERADHLYNALQSVTVAQTLQPQQIILVEDGALSRSLRAVVNYWQRRLGERMLILKNRQNVGLTKSLNRAITRANCSLIARMDSDDVSLPDRFERQVRFLRNHPDTAIVGGAIEEFSEDTQKVKVRQYPLTHDKIVGSIHRHSPLAHPAVMMRRKIFTCGVRYDERCRTSQDIALWFEAIERGWRMANIKDVVLRFRCDKSTYARRSASKAWTEMKIYCRGIHSLYGLISWRYIYPLCRFCMRLLPPPIIKLIYRSPIRAMVTR